ncbi:MAG: DUF2442 domain-containing protein [Gemmatales bacterium]
MKILRITAIKLTGPHNLWLRFNNGYEGEVNLTPLLSGLVFVPLQNPDYFAQVELNAETGTITWPNGADFAPEALLELCQAFKAKLLMGTKL